MVVFAMHTAELARLIEKTRLAMPNGATRYYLHSNLNGIHLHVRGDRLCSAATDRRYLARAEIALPAGAEAMPPVTVPRDTVDRLRAFLKATRGLLEIGVKTDEISFAYNNKTLRSNLIDGIFPDYERVIPTRNDRIAVVAKRQFKNWLSHVYVAAPKIKERGTVTRPVLLAFTNDSLRIHVAECARPDIACDYRGKPLTVRVNARYLLNVASQIDGPQMRFEMKDSTTPIVIKDVTDPSVLFLVMPERD